MYKFMKLLCHMQVLKTGLPDRPADGLKRRLEVRNMSDIVLFGDSWNRDWNTFFGSPRIAIAEMSSYWDLCSGST